MTGTNPSSGSGPQPTPPGWYPDPSGSGLNRWYDGINWSAVTQSATPAPALIPLVQANPTTGFTWAMVAPPVVIVVELLVEVMTGGFTSTQTPDTSYTMVDLTVLLLRLLGWLAYPALAFLDSRALRTRGIQPFPWGWAFVPVVYLIGRTVVGYRQTRRGRAPLFLWLAFYAVAQLAYLVVLIGYGIAATA